MKRKDALEALKNAGYRNDMNLWHSVLNLGVSVSYASAEKQWKIGAKEREVERHIRRVS